MAFLSDNIVFKEENLPFNVNSLDYCSELNVFAVRDTRTVYVWDPESRKITARFDVGIQGYADVVFLPGNYIAATGGHASVFTSEIRIYSLDEEDVLLVINKDDFCEIHLSPEKNLLALAMNENIMPDVKEISIDMKNKKVLSKKTIWNITDDVDDAVDGSICCSTNYNLCYINTITYNFVVCVDVKFSADGEVSLTNKQFITYCMINGEKRSFGKVYNIAHDGEHLIVETDQDIILLESAREGSRAHVIVSSGIRGVGRMKLNNENLMMVCERENVIKVYDYKRPNCLRGLCRCQINKSLKQTGTNKNASVGQLPIPQCLKNYLLYKV